jgi:HK97 family phage prohead protease
MKLFATITKLDEEQQLVFGYASTEALDSQHEIVKREALEAALPSYLKFANIREMHGASAVGVAKEASIDHKGLYLAAKVVDPLAWHKVKEGVYKGFSIGGKALKRDPANRHVITQIELHEISLVDRPANPEAVFDIYKVTSVAGQDDEPDWWSDLQNAVNEALAAADGENGATILTLLKPLKAYLDAGGEVAAPVAVAPARAPAKARKPRTVASTEDDTVAMSVALGDIRKYEASIAKMSAQCTQLAAELERLSRQPLPGKGVLLAVDKSADGLAKAAEPQDTLSLIREAHRNPIRLF